MPACPLCEHVQDLGDACDVCGRPLAAAGVAPAPVAPIEGLEATIREAAVVDAPATVEGLEPTLHAEVAASPPAAPAEAALWVEDTAFAAVEVVAEALPDVERLERGASLPEPDPFAAPTCRYCRTTGMPGDVFCQTCGMRYANLASRPPEPEPETPRCPVCGRAGAGPTCRACGARVGAPG